MRLYHAGFYEIQEPDIYYGRKNADFGQGFYLTKDREFACRWATQRPGADTVVNEYDLLIDDLSVHHFQRETDWFTYIFNNRRGKQDELHEDVIWGPIANDTIYNTFGIITSGYLKSEEALQLLKIGPAYEQIVIKTPKAAAALKWITSSVLDPLEVEEYKKTMKKEEEEYQKAFADEMKRISS